MRRSFQKFHLILFLLLSPLIFQPFSVLQAHPSDVSYLVLKPHPGGMEGNMAFNLLDLEAMGIDANHDEKISHAEILTGSPRLFSLIQSQVQLLADYSASTIKPGEIIIQGATPDENLTSQTDLLVPKEQFLQRRVLYHFSVAWEQPPAQLTVHGSHFGKFPGSHSTVITVWMGEEPQSGTISAKRPALGFNTGGQAKMGSLLISFCRMGMDHIFEGYDHILFLMALLVMGNRLLHLIQIVTSFTIAHSITLILAAQEIWSPPSRWIECAIALSIVYVAAENLWWLRKTSAPKLDRRWILTGFFGLVHGFGFANVLRDIGLPQAGRLPSLLMFNVGVELGQICIILVIFPIILWIARQPWRVSCVRGTSLLVGLLGVAWLVERLFNLKFMPF